MSRCYLVSTPIGNLGDLTHRAVEVLGSVERVLAEDTRRTSILLRHYGIRTRLVSAHAHNEAGRAAQVAAWLDAGEDLALVSDAGTPLLSDPGARIVRSAIAAGHEVVPVPGASAMLPALVVSGLEAEPFTFYGFLARGGKEREGRLTALAALDHTAVVYESPARLEALLEELAARCGPERQVAVARELTKVHEEVFRGTLAEAVAYYGGGPVRGEVVVVLGGRAPAAAAEEDAAVRELARALLAESRRPSAVAREVARRLGVPRNRAYEIVLSLRAGGEGGEAP